MRLRNALPWLLLFIVLAYMATQQSWWPGPVSTPSPTLASQRPLPQPPVAGNGPVSYAGAVGVAAPAVVNIYTTQKVRMTHPFMSDPFLRRFFGEACPRNACSPAWARASSSAPRATSSPTTTWWRRPMRSSSRCRTGAKPAPR